MKSLFLMDVSEIALATMRSDPVWSKIPLPIVYLIEHSSMLWNSPHRREPDRSESRSDPAPSLRDPLGARYLTATPAELTRLHELLNTPPRPATLDAAAHASIVNEVRQIINFTGSHTRLVHTEIINGVVQQAISQYCVHAGLPAWKLVAIQDELRRGTDRSYTFGQITDRGEECFGGLWHLVDGERQALVAFKIRAIPELLSFTQRPIKSVEQLERIYQRGPRGWIHQVPRESELGQWLQQIFGATTLGYFQGFKPLGVFCDAVRRFADAEGISHLLLPRSRRDPGTRPWHIGAFMTFDGERFIWSGDGLRNGFNPTHVTLGIRPHAEILDIQEITPKQAAS
ncbi:MAG: hypothetical protein EBZ48_03985 [Proteobacteria bacterium]|nr:hypothetical protein [Pseudomonadota bacterium]